MNVVIAFLISLTVYVIQTCLAYTESIRNSMYYYPIAALISILDCLNFYYMIKTIPRIKLYQYSMIWGVLAASVYFLTPILLFKVKLAPLGIVGLIMMLVGTLLVNIQGN